MAQYLSKLPINALVKFGKHSVGSESAQPIIWRVIDKNHSGYPSNSVTLITDKIIDIRAYDYGEGENNLQNANYAQSSLGQWLNSEGSANNWYKATHSEDVAPPYTSRPGFLYNFAAYEKLAILPTTLTNQIGSDTSSTMIRKVFLPSAWEVVGSHSIADGSSRFSGFTSTDVKGYLTSQAFSNTTSMYKPTTVDAPFNYVTRSTARSTDSNVGYIIQVLSTGGSNWGDPREDLGVRPCANLSANTKVSDTIDTDGCYTVLNQTTPVISGSNGDLGTKDVAFSQTYSVNDTDKDVVTVTEYIDNVKIRSYTATLGATNTFAVTGNTWLKLSNGNHTLKITATDGFEEVTRTYTFVKSVKTLVVQRTTPLDSSTQPKSIIVTVVKNIPPEASFKVEVCNNGYDGNNIVWDDITAIVLRGGIANFSNVDTPEKTAINTSGKWGVNIRVTVARNGGEGACYITEIGGNFE